MEATDVIWSVFLTLVCLGQTI